MSWSRTKDDDRRLERVIVGVGMSGADSCVPGNGDVDHTSAKEHAYLERIRDRAHAVAKDILADAFKEAAVVRKSAYGEGYAQGRQEGLADLQQRFDAFLDSMRGEKSKVVGAVRRDLACLTRLAVEKVLKLELDARREECLQSLMEEALFLVDSHRELNLTVHPDDKPLIGELLEKAAARFPNLSHWHLRTDTALKPGGVIVECEDGMVDNSISGRWSAVAELLEQLDLNGDE